MIDGTLNSSVETPLWSEFQSRAGRLGWGSKVLKREGEGKARSLNIMTTQKTMLFAAQVFISPASVLDGRPTMVHDYRNDNTTETPGNLLMRRVRKELRELTLSGHSRLANPPPQRVTTSASIRTIT